MADIHSISDAKCIAETDQAIRVTAPDFDAPEWIPKSAIHDDSEIYELGGEGTLVVAEWLARKRGWT
jgi:hypothetical protein